MLAIVESAVLAGMASHPVRVEVQATRGVPSFELVGLAETAVRESRVRVKSALTTVGVHINEWKITVSLAPADLRKSGSAFDLAIALGILVALEHVSQSAVADVLLLGELSLNGAVQSFRGVIAHLLAARARNVRRAIVPRANEREAALVDGDGIDVELASSLGDIVGALRGERCLSRSSPPLEGLIREPTDDLSDVRGQYGARRSLEVAASGAHNLLMMGPPGAGKTMLARRLPGILPQLTKEEALEVIAIQGIAGLIGSTVGVERPFRAPHHTTSDVALVGGGDHVRPGEVSLAHHGVLFLDELTELRRPALEALRQPLEDGLVTVCRTRGTATFPARPMFVAATNPCACGFRGDDSRRCICSPEAIRSYRRRLSGPLLDRMDIHVILPRVEISDLHSSQTGEPSSVVRGRVEKARAIQLDRFNRGEVRARTNAHLHQKDVERVCKLDAKSQRLLERATERRGLSARAFGKVLRVARTIADLEGATAIRDRHVAEAISGRVLDRDESNGKAA